MQNLEIQCKRLKITTFTEDMAQVVHENSLDENNRRFVSDEVFETVDDAKETITFLLSCYKNSEGPFVYPIILNTGENIGYVQLISLNVDKWEVGYHIAEKYTGKGYATEALTAFLPVIMPAVQISEVWGICHSDNIASCRVLEKCSFKLYSKELGDYKGEKCYVCKYIYTYGG